MSLCKQYNIYTHFFLFYITVATQTRKPQENFSCVTTDAESNTSLMMTLSIKSLPLIRVNVYGTLRGVREEWVMEKRQRGKKGKQLKKKKKKDERKTSDITGHCRSINQVLQHLVHSCSKLKCTTVSAFNCVEKTIRGILKKQTIRNRKEQEENGSYCDFDPAHILMCACAGFLFLQGSYEIFVFTVVSY